MAETDWGLFASYAGLLSLATLSIYCGAFGSLPASPRGPKAPSQSLLEDDHDEEEDLPDRLTSGEAWLFPIFGSVALFGFYLVVKYVGKEWINWFLGWYFSLAGAGSVWKSTVSFARFVIGRERWRGYDQIRLFLLKGPRQTVSLSLRTPTLVLLPVGILPSILYGFSAGSHKPALLTDILALSFSHNALSILKLDTFQTGCILLSGLFFYDIYWVFGTEVMLKVATSLDVPIKLLWPKSMTFGNERGFTMLGLGDVVIPGLFISLALRYDHARAEKKERSFAKPYFMVTLTGYIVGLITTMTVMHACGKGQPALLYLSPACILSLVGTAFVRGELGDVWRWTDQQVSAKSAQEACAASRALPSVENGNGAPQPDARADGGDTDGEGTEADGEETNEQGTDKAKTKKRRGKGRKKM